MAYIDTQSKFTHRIPRKVIITVFSMALFASLCIILVLSLQIRIFSNELDQSRRAEMISNRDLAEMKEKIVRMESEVANLVESRLPHLKELVFDEVIPIDGQFVKNIVFTLTGKNDKKLYEYKAVFENSSSQRIEPMVSIIFFDRLGIQIGRSDIGGDLSETGSNFLEEGETRSYYNKIQFPSTSTPHYFMVSSANNPRLLSTN